MKLVPKLLKSHRTVVVVAFAALLTQQPLEGAGKMIASFANDDSLESWTSVNDGVMGGVSKGGFKRTGQGTLLFTGDLSLANNGGFASVRTAPDDYSAPGTRTFRLAVRGDGRRYKLNLRTDDAYDGPSYQAVFSPPAGEWS